MSSRQYHNVYVRIDDLVRNTTNVLYIHDNMIKTTRGLMVISSYLDINDTSEIYQRDINSSFYSTDQSHLSPINHIFHRKQRKRSLGVVAACLRDS